MHKTRFIILTLIAVFTAVSGAETASRIPAVAGAGATVEKGIGSGVVSELFVAGDPFASFPGLRIPRAECATIEGGDIRMVLNAAKNKLQVSVISNEYEARLGRIPPIETYEIDVHNRVVDTTLAPFIPTKKSRAQTSVLSGLTSKPEQFPEGYWEISGLRTTEGKYGPYTISTNAVGKVDVFSPNDSNGKGVYVGTCEDTGYALHSNSNPFGSSKSNGCLILKEDDCERLAIKLANDRMDDKNAKQTIRVKKKNR
ncbi:MAG: hypothetical protein ABFC81_02645 [Rectinema sp.]